MPLGRGLHHETVDGVDLQRLANLKTSVCLLLSPLKLPRCNNSPLSDPCKESPRQHL